MTPIGAHRIFLRLSLAATHVFVWVFAYHYFASTSSSIAAAFISVASVYIIAQITSALFTPIAARRLRGGARKLMVAATLSLAGATGVIALMLTGSIRPEWAFGLFAVLFGLYRALYFVPYRFMAQGSGVTNIIVEACIALSPALVGYLIATGNSAAVILASGAVLALVSVLPLMRLAESHEGFSWSYTETFHNVFASFNRSTAQREFLSGAEGAALLFIWPLIVFVMLDGSYAAFGAVISLTLLASIVFGLLWRSYVRRFDTPLVHAVFSATAWMLRGTVLGPIGVVVVDTYAATARPHSRGIDLLVLEQSADSRSYIDEMSALKEIAQALGRIAIVVIFSLLVVILPLPYAILSVFTLAALAVAQSHYIAARRE